MREKLDIHKSSVIWMTTTFLTKLIMFCHNYSIFQDYKSIILPLSKKNLLICFLYNMPGPQISRYPEHSDQGHRKFEDTSDNLNYFQDD